MKLTKQKTARYLRWMILAVSTIFFLFFSHFLSVHAICPIGGFEIFFTGIFRSGFSITGLFSAMVIIFLIMSVVSIFFRRAYCAYICPLGALQELSQAIGKKVLPEKILSFRMPYTLDRTLRWFKYIVLALFIIFAGVLGGHWMIKFDPFISMLTLFSNNSIIESIQRGPSSFVFLVLVLLYAFFFGKGFCKYICPAGAWYALLSKISPNKIVRNSELCVSCNLCTKVCPANIDVAQKDKVDDGECFGCKECVNVCPKEGALSAPIGKIEMNQVVVPLSMALVLAGSLTLASTMPSPNKGREGGHPQGTKEGSPPQGVELEQNADDPDKSKTSSIGPGGCTFCIGCGLC